MRLYAIGALRRAAAAACVLGAGVFLVLPASAQRYPTGLIFSDPKDAENVPPVELTRAYIPEAIDLSDRFPPPGAQKFGSCVSWATAYAARSYYNVIGSGASPADINQRVSPTYLHNNMTTPATCRDAGADMQIALNFLRRKGAPSISAYDTTQICAHTAPRVEGAVTFFRISGYRRIVVMEPETTTPVPRAAFDRMKQEMAKGNPVLFSMHVGDDFQDFSGTGVFTGTQRGEKGKDGHAMVMVGYDDRRDAFRILNSWGTTWGDAGLAWVSRHSLTANLKQAWVMDVDTAVPKPVPNRPVALNTKIVTCEKPDAHPWPVCEALETLAQPLHAASLPRLVTTSGKTTLHYNETMGLTVSAPDFPSFLYLVYLQADGKAVNLLPRRGQMRQQTPPGTVLTFGDGQEGRARFKVSPPSGTEAVIAIAARSPIAELEALENDGAIYKVAAAVKNPLDNSDSPPDRAFLSALRTGLMSRPDQTALPREVAAAVLHLTVEP